MTNRLDRLLLAAMTRGRSGPIESYAGAATRGSQSAEALDDAFETIDAKASGTLTHVSMMIAALGLIAPIVAGHRLEELMVIVQIGVYLLVALGCLRCLSLFNSRDISGTPEQVSQQIVQELFVRRELYSICNRATIWLTLFVLVSIPVLWLIEL